MKVRVNTGAGSAEIRSKADQDRSDVRALIVKREADLQALRGRERELSIFIRTLDHYDPPAEPNALLMVSDSSHGHGAAASAASAAASAASAASTAASAATSAALGRAVDAAVQNIHSGASELAVAASHLHAPRYYGGGAAKPVSATAYANAAVQSAASEAVSIYNYNRAVRNYVAHGLPREGSNMRIVTDTVARAIELFGEPMKTADLLDLIRREEAFSLLGQNKASTLSSYLSRDPRFYFERGTGWVLQELPELAVIDQGDQDQPGSQQEGEGE